MKPKLSDAHALTICSLVVLAAFWYGVGRNAKDYRTIVGWLYTCIWYILWYAICVYIWDIYIIHHGEWMEQKKIKQTKCTIFMLIFCWADSSFDSGPMTLEHISFSLKIYPIHSQLWGYNSTYVICNVH